jgi:hypothetical protein
MMEVHLNRKFVADLGHLHSVFYETGAYFDFLLIYGFVDTSFRFVTGFVGELVVKSDVAIPSFPTHMSPWGTVIRNVHNKPHVCYSPSSSLPIFGS